MTLGEKLVKLRKENSYTQEQLAELLGVSRQSVSKWESDIAYPETDKLIEIGRLFNCSMDYLLKNEITDKTGKPDNCAENKTAEIGRNIISHMNKITLTKVINIAIRIIGVIIAIDVIAAVIYSIICGMSF